MNPYIVLLLCWHCQYIIFLYLTAVSIFSSFTYKVKRETIFKTWATTSILANLPQAVLGQHGIELLMEKKNSFFNSGVAGFICIGTKVRLILIKIHLFFTEVG